MRATSGPSATQKDSPLQGPTIGAGTAGAAAASTAATGNSPAGEATAWTGAVAAAAPLPAAMPVNLIACCMPTLTCCGLAMHNSQGAMPRETDFKQTLCADSNGLSLHAAVRCGADERQGLEPLCRHITRPALANERVQTNAAGQVVLKLKTPWRDGTTHLLMSPLEFIQRRAVLLPRPRLYLIGFGVRITSLREVSGPPLREHGVLASNAKLRAQVVPQEPEPPAQAAPPTECEATCAHHRLVRLSWVKLLKRAFEIDMECRPNCGGGLKVIAAILERPVIEKILTHLGLEARAPPCAPACGS